MITWNGVVVMNSVSWPNSTLTKKVGLSVSVFLSDISASFLPESRDEIWDHLEAAVKFLNFWIVFHADFL